MLASSTKHRHVETSAGVRLPCVEYGHENGMPVIFLHGYSDSWRSFEPILPFLPAHLRTILVTQRGHGDADRPPRGYRVRRLAMDLADVMDALSIRRAVIVGHSWGSYVAQRFALDHPSRVYGVVLAGSYPSTKNNQGVVELANAVAELPDLDPAFVSDFQKSTLGSPIPDDLLRGFVEESLKAPLFVWRQVVRGIVRDDHSRRLRNLTAPVRVIWGDRDEFFPWTVQEQLLRAIPHAELSIYHGAGHAVHWEQPERFAADVAGFAGRFCS